MTLNLYTQKEIARLQSKIEKTPTERGCLLWTGYKNKGGYGRIMWRGKMKFVHRIIWEIANGRSIKEGMYILHSCDNPTCCNPAHLREGTNQDNSSDMVHRNRQASGEANGSSKLTEVEVLKIRKLNASGVNAYKLAEMFGVTHAIISKIVIGKLWKSAGGPIRKSMQHITFSEVEQIRAFWEDKNYPILQRELAEIFDVSFQHISLIVRYKTRISK